MMSTKTIESTLVHWFSGGKRVSYARSKVHAWKPVRRQVAVASLKIKRAQNVDGEFFVDHSCIDCDTCRWMAPDIFKRTGEMSAVFKQPTSGQERLKALQALLSCPTNSIHTENPAPDILDAQKTFPMTIDEERIPGVYHCGYHSKDSFGAASYLIVHPEGNILIDSPRYTERLAINIEKLGGARYMFLTHRDDVADHVKWSKRLSCERILHFKDTPSRKDHGIEGGIPVVFSLEKPKAKLLPFKGPSGEEENPSDYQIVPGFRVRIIPVLGTIPAIFWTNNGLLCSDTTLRDAG